MNKKIYIILTVALILMGGVVILVNMYSLFSFSIEPQSAILTLDGITVPSGKAKIVRTGTHAIKAQSKDNYYFPLSETISIKPGRNIYRFKLPTKQDKLVEQLPIYDEKWDIDYIREINKFSVTLKVGPIAQTKSEAISYLIKSGVKVTEDQIIWNTVAGIDNQVGP